jgi:hypothetical protein
LQVLTIAKRYGQRRFQMEIDGCHRCACCTIY